MGPRRGSRPSSRRDFDSGHAAAVLLSSGRLPSSKEVGMSVTDEYLENNEEYAKNFSGPLPLVACMDVIRNAEGVITDDEIRSLAISQRFLGTKESTCFKLVVTTPLNGRQHQARKLSGGREIV
jgi:hypothetical protein